LSGIADSRQNIVASVSIYRCDFHNIITIQTEFEIHMTDLIRKRIYHILLQSYKVMVHRNRPVVAREYKLILNNMKFEEKEYGIEKFVNVVKNLLQGSTEPEGEAHFIPIRDYKKRSVWYLDTIDSKIKDSSFLLRIRKENDEEYVTSLKCRSPDRYIASSYDLSSDKQEVKSKFEEDIIAPFGSNFSLSATFETKNEPHIESIGDLVSIFPGLSELNLNQDETLHKVNNFEAREFSCQIGSIAFGKEGSTAETSLEFWYLPGEVKNQPPLIVEFTFDYDATELEFTDKSKKGSLLEEFPTSQVATANLFYRSLQAIKEFEGPENAKTKTQFAYEYKKDI
jgi:hypothetical protein